MPAESRSTVPPVQRLGQARESLGCQLGVTSQADPEAIGALEVVAWHNAGCVLLSQQAAKALNLAATQTRERRGADNGHGEFNGGMASKRLYERLSVCSYEPIRAAAEPVEPRKGMDAEQLCQVDRRCRKQIVEFPDALGKRRFGEDPPTTQPG